MSYSRNSRKREEKKVNYLEVFKNGTVKWQNIFETLLNGAFKISIIEYKGTLYLLKQKEGALTEAHDISEWYRDTLRHMLEELGSQK